MFWFYSVIVITTGVGWYMFMTRDSDSDSWIYLVVITMAIQAASLEIGGYVAWTISALLFGFSIFLIAGVLQIRNAEKAKLVDDVAPAPGYKQSAIAKAVYESDDGTDRPLDKWIRSKRRIVHEEPQIKSGRKKSTVKGTKLDVVNFDYINAEGEYSSRRIVVRVLADTYFEGIDTEIHETRTFRYDRVVGLITSEETGEIIDPEAWATAARNPFANKPSQSTGRQLQKSVSIEICFTGFAKADKSNLEEMAESAGMIVRKSVTNGLTHLCAGPNAGPSKLSKAGEVGAEVIDEGEFYSLFAES